KGPLGQKRPADVTGHAMNERISVGEVKDLGGGKYLVRLDLGTGEAALSQTQTVSADGCDAAVQIAKAAFSRWLTQILECSVKNMPSNIRNYCTPREILKFTLRL